MDDQLAMLDHVKRTALDLAIQFGPKVLIAVLILVAGFVVGKWVGKVMDTALAKFHLEPPVRQLLVRIARGLVLGLFFIMALQNLGVELLPLIAGLSVAGAGIALAMQGVLSNVTAGLTIIFTRPFRVGEYVSIVGNEGQVETISIFNTVLAHPDLSRVVIPNRKIVGEILHNYGHIRQVEVVVSVAYGSDLNAAFAAIRDVLQKNTRVLQDPAPLVFVNLLGATSIDVAVKPWTKVADYPAAGGEIKQAIAETFSARNITIPFPRYEVQMLGNN